MSLTSAFKEGTAGVFTPGDLNLSITGVIAAVLFAWVAWIAISSYRAYAANQISAQDLPIRVLRAVVVMLVLFFLCFY